MADPAELAVRLHDSLEKAGVPHAIGGAIAYGFHAEPRATADIDLNLFIDEKALSGVLLVLEQAGCRLDRAEAARRVTERGDFVARLEGYRVDAFVSFHPFHQEVRRRVRAARLLGREIPILSAEDLIVFKVLFDRPKDWIDITNMLAAGGRTLDRAYLDKWLNEILSPGDERKTRIADLIARYGT